MGPVNIRFAVVDDEPIARKGLIRMLDQFQGMEMVGEANSPDSWQLLCDQCQPDLVFMDIMLRDSNILDQLQTGGRQPLVVFTTAYPQYAVRSYTFSALDYLLKPIAPEDLQRAVERAKESLSSRSATKSDSVFLRVNGKFQRILFKDIICVEGMENYIVVHTLSHKYVVRETMRRFENRLPKNKFFRVHRSWIVNLDGIEAIDKSELIAGTKRIPVSRELRQQVHEMLMRD